ncbi:MAG TPA: hypothetical protein VHV78_18090, partial [Gemmatimonadaceae bacterium]|nr:hypothetical protein [Gemmatimonadaceae bacterium]
ARDQRRSSQLFNDYILLEGIMMRSSHVRLAGTIARAASFAALAALLAGCISIPQSAWRNGESLSNSRAYQRVLSGDMSFATRRDLQNVLNFGSLGYQEGPAFSPFPKSGSWY